MDLLALAKRGRCVNSLLSGCTRKKYQDYSYLRLWIDETVPDAISGDEFNYHTRTYWILFGLTDFPKCKTCGAQIRRNVHSIYMPRYNHCGMACANRDPDMLFKKVLTCLENRGTDYPSQSKDVIERRHANNVKKYGVPEPSQLESVKESIRRARLSLHGGKWESPESARRRAATSLGRYGNVCALHGKEQKRLTRPAWLKYRNGSPLSDDRIRVLSRERMARKYGCDYFARSEESKRLWDDSAWRSNSPRRQYETKRRNNSFHTSRQEQLAYEMLAAKYGEDDVARQFASDEYPFACDFYVRSLGLYVECNFTWTHGGHWFDPDSERDREKLAKWK